LAQNGDAGGGLTMSVVEGRTDMPLKRAHLHQSSQILWCGLAHVQADRSPGPGLLLHFTD
jgi:hypothetical protein